MKFLEENPTHIGRVLMGSPGPWNKKHVRELELVVCGLEHREAIRNYLSILHEAARLWSADTLKRVPLPHFLPRVTQFDNPFTENFSSASRTCEAWKQKLATLIACHDGDRDLRVAGFLLSAILNGRALGAPVLVALIRAIPDWKRRTFEIGGRVHVELGLSRRGVRDAEHRIWLPDPITAVLMARLQPHDAANLLAPVVRDGYSFQPSDAAVMRRIGRLIGQFRSRTDQEHLPGLEETRRSAREVALVGGVPALVAYDSAELASESLRRQDVARIFPGHSVREFIEPEITLTESAGLAGTHVSIPVPEWLGCLKLALRSANQREALNRVAEDSQAPEALRLIADFSVAMTLRTSRPGKPLSNRAIEKRTLMLSDCLGHVLESEDLAKRSPADRRIVYLDAINAQPVRKRPDAVQAVREFDLYLVAKFDGTLPIPRNSLPWFRKPPAFDPNIITHSEYQSILTQLEVQPWLKRSVRKIRMTLLIVILAFRCMLRRGELRGLRIEDVLLLLDDPALGDPEIQVRPRKEDPLKTPAAERRIPLRLLSDDELHMLKDWLRVRLSEKAKASDYFFAIPTEHIRRVPKSFFDSLNHRLRKLTRYAAGGKGVHLHHCRHAGGTWLFVGMLLADSPRRRQLFADLEEFHVWMQQNALKLRELFWDKQVSSRRLPYAVAVACGQASFDTTANSYINIFPWLAAHDADGTRSEERDLLRVASEAPRKKFTKWIRAGGPNNIAKQVMIREGLRVKAESTLNSRKASEASSDLSWLIAIWHNLARRRRGNLSLGDTPELAAMFERAEWMMVQVTHTRSPRHRAAPLLGSESAADSAVDSLAPLRPQNARNDISPSLLRSIREQSAIQGVAFAAAIGAFGSFHERHGFVAFDSIKRIAAVDGYIGLLRTLGFSDSEFDVICSTAESNSDAIEEWRRQLVAEGHKGLPIQPSPAGGSYAPRGSLWVRPNQHALRLRGTGPSGFRFLMQMAFIIFGDIPGRATVAPSPVTK